MRIAKATSMRFVFNPEIIVLIIGSFSNRKRQISISRGIRVLLALRSLVPKRCDGPLQTETSDSWHCNFATSTKHIGSGSLGCVGLKRTVWHGTCALVHDVVSAIARSHCSERISFMMQGDTFLVHYK